MNAVVRQRRANARRIAQATAVTAAAVVLGGGVAQANARPPAATALPAVSADRADAVSGVPTAIELLAGTLPAEHSLVALTATPDHGRAVLNDDATATYTSVPGFTGSDSFGYRFTDDRGRAARVTVTVTVSHGTTPATAYAVTAYAA